MTLEESGWNEVFARRFQAKILKTDGCWLWTPALKSKYRYGTFSVAGRLYRVNRLAFLVHHGSIDDELEVCHECDNDKCVRPDHLFQDDHSGNMADMVTKRRQALHKGVDNGRAKLTADDVVAIRKAVAAGSERKPLARQYGVDQVTIGGIVHGRLWKHLGGPLTQPRPRRKKAA